MPATQFSTRNIILFLIVVAGLVAGAYFLFSASSEEEVVAEVGAESITRHEIEVRIRQSLVRGQTEGLSVPEDALFDRSLDDLITESLLYQDAVRKGFVADPTEVEARYTAIADNYDSEEKFLESMERNLLTPEEFRRNIARQIVLFTYLEELKRQEIEEQLQAAIGHEADSPSLEITAEPAALTQDDINRLSEARSEELKKEFSIEVYTH